MLEKTGFVKQELSFSTNLLCTGVGIKDRKQRNVEESPGHAGKSKAQLELKPMRNKGNKKCFYLYINGRINRENVDLLLSGAVNFVTADIFKAVTQTLLFVLFLNKISQDFVPRGRVQERGIFVVEATQVWNLF